MNRKLATWVYLGLGIVLAIWVAVSLASKGSHSFEVSNDASIRVLEVESSGGISMEKTRYELFGDGRLVGLTVSGFASGAPQQIFSEQLPLEEFDALISDLVGSGVMEYDAEEMNARMEEVPLPTDQTTTVFTIRLNEYDGRQASSSSAVEHRFSVHGASVRAQQFPEIREVAALGRLVQRIAEIHRRHLRRAR